jgi:radical SAM protein with 4Fe4S-binding SPASM domain
MDVLEQIIELKVFRVFLSGGEPLLRRDFFMIADRLSRANVKLVLFTNGTLITPAIARRLKNYPTMSFHVSIDGASAATHDAMRGKGSFVKSIRGVRNLITQKCAVTIAATMTGLNYHEAEGIILLGKSMGVEKVQLVELMCTGDTLRHHQDLAMTAEERFDLLSKVWKLKVKYGGFLTGSISANLSLAGELKPDLKLKFPIRTRLCSAGTEQCAIRADGWVVPCERLWFLKAGNLRKKSLRAIWCHSPVMRSFRKGFTIRKKDVSECIRCKYLRPCYLVRRCKPYFFFRGQAGQKDPYCLGEGSAC